MLSNNDGYGPTSSSPNRITIDSVSITKGSNRSLLQKEKQRLVRERDDSSAVKISAQTLKDGPRTSQSQKQLSSRATQSAATSPAANNSLRSCSVVKASSTKRRVQSKHNRISTKNTKNNIVFVNNSIVGSQESGIERRYTTPNNEQSSGTAMKVQFSDKKQDLFFSENEPTLNVAKRVIVNKIEKRVTSAHGISTSMTSQIQPSIENMPKVGSETRKVGAQQVF